MIARAPAALKLAADRRKWADEQIDEREAGKLEELQAALDSGRRLEAIFQEGELRMIASGTTILSKIYLDENAGRLAEAHWRLLLLSRKWREAGRLAAELRRPPAAVASQAATQFIERVNRLAQETLAISAGERDMNERLFALYDLSAEERLLVESGMN